MLAVVLCKFSLTAAFTVSSPSLWPLFSVLTVLQVFKAVKLISPRNWIQMKSNAGKRMIQPDPYAALIHLTAMHICQQEGQEKEWLKAAV